MSDELKPCPFCGNDPKYSIEIDLRAQITEMNGERNALRAEVERLQGEYQSAHISFMTQMDINNELRAEVVRMQDDIRWMIKEAYKENCFASDGSLRTLDAIDKRYAHSALEVKS